MIGFTRTPKRDSLLIEPIGIEIHLSDDFEREDNRLLIEPIGIEIDISQ